MYGPNYVKLSRFFAVQLFSMIIEHYAALPPVRSDPHWSHSHAIIASIRLALAHTLQYPLLATQTSTAIDTDPEQRAATRYSRRRRIGRYAQ
jgi:hypothetical protein